MGQLHKQFDVQQTGSTQIFWLKSAKPATKIESFKHQKQNFYSKEV